MPAPKLHRFLDLIAFLAGRRRPVPAEVLMESLPAYSARWSAGDERERSSVRRMFERDKDELRRLGIPIRTVEGGISREGHAIAGYELARRDFYLPYLRLFEDSAAPEGAEAREVAAPRASMPQPTFEIGTDEVAAAIEGLLHLSGLPDFPLAREARSAHRKFTFDLDPSRFRSSPVVVLPSSGAPTGEVASLLTDALLRRRRVHFDYRGIRQEEWTKRDVAPYGLLFQQGHWYLVGHDAVRDAVRVFRLSRMANLDAGSSRRPGPEFELSTDFDLSAYAGRRAWELGTEDEEAPTSVCVKFSAGRSLWADRNGYGMTVERAADGTSVRTFEVSDPAPFLSWILSLEGEAELQEPLELREGVRRAAERVVALHESR